MNLIIETGLSNRVGIYEILYEAPDKHADGHRQYCAKCLFCGKEFIKRMSDLKRAKSCRHITLGGIELSSVYKWQNKRIGAIFRGMKYRCYSQQSRDYPLYGGKGIRIFQDWLISPLSFEDWALANGYRDGLTIDRVDPSKDYCPMNCRWVPLEANARYKSTTTLLRVDEKEHTGREWAQMLALGSQTINKYLRQYPEDTVKEFIRRRLDNPNTIRKTKQTWLDAYGLE